MKYSKVLAITFLIPFSALCEVVSIPLNYTAYPAKDLVDQNNNLLTTSELRKIWRQKQDLSHLNPAASDIWQDKMPEKLTKEQDDFKILEDEKFSYVDKVISVVGSFRFLIRETKSKRKRNFNVWLSKDNRSILLRKNLLRKLGYNVPKVQHKQSLTLSFNGKASMDAFIRELENGTFADSARWIVSQNEEKFEIQLQDVLLLEGNTRIYNLAMGELAPSTVSHRRAFNALSLIYALVDVRESVDGLPWSAGRIDNKVVIFDIISGDKFTTTYYDAMWILKRMAKLEKSDLKQVVEYAYLPSSVSMLLVEKLYSRLNSMFKHFFEKPPRKYEVNFNVSDGSGELVKGRLTQNVWQGHAARYSFDDTESPLSKDEMVAYFKSKFYSGVIENLVNYVNTNLLYETDIQKEAIERAIEAQQNQLRNFFKTGQFEEIPFSSWAIPTAKGNIRASRDVITGSYLGTDNTIQLADTLEFIGELGVFVGTLGLPVEVQAFLSGSARFSRSYTHVKSIKSIKKALDEPFRNIIVPALKKKKARSIISMIDNLKSEEFNSLDGEERVAEVEKILKELDRILQVGDSLIISNNLVLGGSLTGGYRVPVNTSEIEAVLNFNARKVNLWRFHILRSSEKVFQFYKSKASALGGGAGISAKAYLPIVNININGQKGDIITQFQSLTLDNSEETDTIIDKLIQLRQVLVENSAELLNKDNPPFIIRHDFKERTKSQKFLANQAVESRLSDKISIEHPEGYETQLHTYTRSVLAGNNYMQLAYDVLNGLLEEFAQDEDVSLSNSGSGNPGDSFYGESFARQTFVEVPYLLEGSEVPFENYAQIKLRWKGWSADRAKLLEIKNKISELYGDDLFNEELFFDTREVKLYSVDVTLSIYAQGIKNLIQTPKRRFEEVLKNHLQIPWPKSRSKFEYRPNGTRVSLYQRKRRRTLSALKKIYQNLNSEYQQLIRPKLVSKEMNTLIHALELMLPFETFKKLIGGDDFFYLSGRVGGYRVGVENGEKALVSNSLGEFGSEFSSGILDTLRKAINISPGELGAYWFLRRVL